MKTLNDIFEEVQEKRRSMNFSPTTERTFKCTATKFIRWLKKNFDIDTADQLRSSHLYAYQKHLATLTNRKGLPFSAGSINGRICAVHILLDYMYTRGYVTGKMSKHINTVKTSKLLPTSVLTHAQVRKLIRAVDTSTREGHRDRAVLEVLYSSGVRGSELAGLKLEDVDLGAGIMKVMGKGRKERIVPIGKTALRWLTSYIRGIRPFMTGHDTYRAVFLNRRGKAYGLKSIQAIAPHYAKIAKLDVHVTPHTFRRSCTTEMIRGNANIYHVKELLGHESIETLKPYTKLTINDLRKTHAKCHPREKDEL